MKDRNQVGDRELEIQRILEKKRDGCECRHGYSEALNADYNCAPNEALKELKRVGDLKLSMQISVKRQKEASEDGVEDMFVTALHSDR